MPFDLMSTMAAVSQGLSIAKGLKEIQDGYDTAEFKTKMAELMSALADAKVALIDAQEEIRSKDSEIERLKAGFAIRVELVEKRGFKFPKGKTGDASGNPFCPRCEQVEARYFRLVNSSQKSGIRGDLVCPECRREYPSAPRCEWSE